METSGNSSTGTIVGIVSIVALATIAAFAYFAMRTPIPTTPGTGSGINIDLSVPVSEPY